MFQRWGRAGPGPRALREPREDGGAFGVSPFAPRVPDRPSERPPAHRSSVARFLLGSSHGAFLCPVQSGTPKGCRSPVSTSSPIKGFLFRSECVS